MGTIRQWISARFVSLTRHNKPASAGAAAEQMAARYLQRQGLKLLARNYRSKVGEIDLIMKDKNGLVFVEVKYRSRNEWADAAEMVTRSKQRRVINAAKHYLQSQGLFDKVHCRFDVLAINRHISEEHIEWLTHAFE